MFRPQREGSSGDPNPRAQEWLRGSRRSPVLQAQDPHISLSGAWVQTFAFHAAAEYFSSRFSLHSSKCAAFLFGWLMQVPGMQQSLQSSSLWETLIGKLQFSQEWVMTFMCLLLGLGEVCTVLATEGG